MKKALVLLAIAAGCGSSGVDCTSLQRQMVAVAAANQSCTQDGDCAFAYDIGPDVAGSGACATFYSNAAPNQMAALMTQFKDGNCVSGCMALAAACNGGVCGRKMTP